MPEERNGRQEETRTTDLYRLKVLVFGFSTTCKDYRDCQALVKYLEIAIALHSLVWRLYLTDALYEAMSSHARRSFGRTCSWHDTDPLIVHSGKRYRMRFRNEGGDTHPLHLHRHSFEITNILGNLTGGVAKDVVLVNPFSTAEIDFVADNPGLTLFHCHAQLHMDFGFMNLIKYS